MATETQAERPRSDSKASADAGAAYDSILETVVELEEDVAEGEVRTVLRDIERKLTEFRDEARLHA